MSIKLTGVNLGAFYGCYLLRPSQVMQFEKDSEQQIVQGMVDLAKFTGIMYNSVPLKTGGRMEIQTTAQRKIIYLKPGF